MQLGDIAEIKTGLVLSRKKAEVEFDARAKYKLLSLKNISDDGMIVNDSFDEFVSKDRLDDHYFTEEGDVLMRLSQPYTAVYINKEHRGLLVPSYFVIIKVHQTKVLPQYLAWFLNSVKVKHELDKSHAGSRIPSTNQKDNQENFDYAIVHFKARKIDRALPTTSKGKNALQKINGRKRIATFRKLLSKY